MPDGLSLFRMRTLGEVDLRGLYGGPAAVRALQPKHQSLLVFLAVDGPGGFHRRDSLVSLFWPELDQAHARASLRKALHHVRGAVGSEGLLTRGHEEVQLDPAVVWCDARELKHLAARGEDAEAVELYRGEFLPGFHVDEAPAFMQWLDTERNRLQTVARTCAMRQAIRCRDEHLRDEAAGWAARAVEIAPLEEQPTRLLMEILDASGDRPAALLAYQRFAQRLASELDLAPSEETRRVAQQLRRLSPVQPETSVSVPMVPPVALVPSPPLPAAVALPPALPRIPDRGEPVGTERRGRPLRGTLVAAALVTLAGVTLVALRGAGLLGGDAGRTPGSRSSLTIERMHAVNTSPDLKVDAALSPDGTQVAYASGPLGAMQIFIQPISGGPARVASGGLTGDHRWPAWSPDGERLLFVTRNNSSIPGGDAYIVPAFGGTPRLLIKAAPPADSAGPGGGVLTPAWSPDGTRIAYSDGTDILLQRVEGGLPVTAATGAHLHSPVFSPDGGRLAYVSGNLWGVMILSIAPSAVCMVHIAESRPRCITDSTHAHTSPRWAPDGRGVLYVSNASSEGDVYEQRLAGDDQPAGAPVRLTTGLGASSLSLALDGSRGVYAVTRLRSQVWMVPLLGPAGPPTPRLVTRDAQAIEGLDLSPDGQWLAFDSNLRGNQDIYKVNLQGGEPLQLTDDPAADFQPRWSADGHEIAYYSMREGQRDIRVMDGEGRNDQPVTTSSLQEGYPSWSPDGQALVYMTAWGSPSSLFIVTRDGDGRWSLPRTLGGEGTAPPVGELPQWSPDGRWIAYRRGGSKPSIWVVSVSGEDPRMLAGPDELGGPVEFFTWGPDSESVYVHQRQVDKGSTFWAIPLTGGPLRLLLRLEDPARRPRRAEFATDGRRLFFTIAADETSLWAMDMRR